MSVATTSNREGAADRSLAGALSPAPRPPRPGVPAQVLAFGWRGMLKIRHVPEQLMDVTVTPVILLLLFNSMFGGAISGSTSDYLQYTLPGLLAMSTLFTTVYSGIALNTDLERGVVDRFRSLPIWRAAPLVGPLLGDVLRYLVAATVIVGLGVALGFDPQAGLPGVLAAVGLIVAFAFGLSWVFTTVGLLVRSQTAVSTAGFMGVFVLTMVSNVFVEPETLPSALEAFVKLNPVSHLADASRAAMAGNLAIGEVAYVLGAAALLTAVFAPLTNRLYRSRS